MPLTTSHPAASIPLQRFGLSLSALIVGSMAPDFSKFATLSPACNFGHSWPGVFWFCIPAGLAVLWIFHFVMKYPLFTLLPVSHQKRLFPFLTTYSFNSVKRLICIMLALVIGAITHLVWDSFTHKNGLVVDFIPILRSEIFVIWNYSVKPYSILQHGSTVVGFALMVFWYFQWFQKANIRDVNPTLLLSPKTKALLLLALPAFALVVGIFYGIWCAKALTGIRALEIFLGQGVVALGVILLLVLLIYCLVWQSNRRKSQRLS